MPLEPNFRFIDDLEVLNPADGDQVAEGDDHLRGLKAALQGTIDGNASQARLKVGADNVFVVSAVDAVLERGDVGTFTIRARDSSGGLGRLLFSNTGPVALRSEITGQGVTLAGGDNENLAQFRVNTGCELFHLEVGRLLTSTEGVKVTGTDIRIDNPLDTQTSLRVYNLAGGYNWRAAIGGTVQLVQTDNAGVAEDTWAQFSRGLGVELFSANVVRFQVDDQGIRSFGQRVDVNNLGSSDSTQITVRNDEGGFRLFGDSDALSIQQTDNFGVFENNWISCANNAGVAFFHDNVGVLRTLDNVVVGMGAEVKDGQGNFQPVGLNNTLATDFAGNFTIGFARVGQWHRVTAPALTLTIDVSTDAAINGSVWVCSNEGGGTLLVDPDGVALKWLDGAGSQTGQRTILAGSYFTITKRSAGNYIIVGGGIT